MMERHLSDILTWAQWFKVAGAGIMVILALYVIGEFVSIIKKGDKYGTNN
jgi:hypothetical protein